ncbi:PaaI family thioesterase [Ramlibacter sp. AW1]|uniref:PaaI family thioesterase n=1 Tax=Ramlibacter aurantiacus TaxID=2801330 RepID=A0A936ZJR0_9BURK|nr:PaaI family thioesterase [Ramlibacter aurantiacus]MBL0421468.1 PaaI family thioesterase [Ramlibacter aurantiacus]
MNEFSQAPEAGFTLMEQGGTFMDHVGPVWSRADADGAVVLLRIGPQHTNPNASVHGGVLMTLIDVALGSALQAAMQGQGAGHPVTMQLSCSMVGAARLGDLVRAEARVDRLARSVGFSSGRIEAGGRLVMTASAVFKLPSS